VEKLGCARSTRSRRTHDGPHHENVLLLVLKANELFKMNEVQSVRVIVNFLSLILLIVLIAFGVTGW